MGGYWMINLVYCLMMHDALEGWKGAPFFLQVHPDALVIIASHTLTELIWALRSDFEITQGVVKLRGLRWTRNRYGKEIKWYRAVLDTQHTPCSYVVFKHMLSDTKGSYCCMNTCEGYFSLLSCIWYCVWKKENTPHMTNDLHYNSFLWQRKKNIL